MSVVEIRIWCIKIGIELILFFNKREGVPTPGLPLSGSANGYDEIHLELRKGRVIKIVDFSCNVMILNLPAEMEPSQNEEQQKTKIYKNKNIQNTKQKYTKTKIYKNKNIQKQKYTKTKINKNKNIQKQKYTETKIYKNKQK
jgi:hypothetical protein